MDHPYKALGEKAFWATAVAQKSPFDILDLWEPKFPISRDDKIVTYGSCFAQHIGRSLKTHGFNWLVVERGPSRLGFENRVKFNYGIFSARTGNIYTASMLRQWVQWATDQSPIPQEVWSANGRFFDPFRPAIEPGGFANEQEVSATRSVTLQAFRKSIIDADVFIFTLGLTESWFNTEQPLLEYPLCPGTAAGEFDPDRHRFINQDYSSIMANLWDAMEAMRRLNPLLKFLLTVSPVPLTATMSGHHVLVATVESKSILRAVAGDLAKRLDYIDYFPSYEIITAPPFRGAFFEPNQRSVNRRGVEQVMSTFFRCLRDKFPAAWPDDPSARAAARVKERASPREQLESIVCEEELLDTFKA
jgi:hypothetical protein